jgi:hypothetical protein
MVKSEYNEFRNKRIDFLIEDRETILTQARVSWSERQLTRASTAVEVVGNDKPVAHPTWLTTIIEITI